MDQIPNRPKIEFTRPRRLVAEERRVETPAPVATPRILTDETFEFVDTVLQKAQRLMAAIEKALLTISVPVREEDVEVRAAVRRKDALSDGAFITFDLYLKALAYEYDSVDLTPAELSSLLTGHQVSDARNLQIAMTARASGVSKDDARLMTSQAMYLYILQLMQMGMQALEGEKQTLTKLPNGSETPAVLLSTVLSIAFQLSYSANLIKDLQTVLQEASGSATNGSKVDISGAVKAAKEFALPPLKSIQLALKSKEPEDYEIIRSYARSFVKRTKKIGYEPWLLADEVYAVNRQLTRTQNSKARYDEGLEINGDLADVIKHQARALSGALDRIATALTSRYSKEDVLCSLLWLTKVEKEPKAIMQALLQSLFDLKSGGIPELPQPSLEDNILDEMIHDLYEVLHKVKTKFLKWLSKDPDVWMILTQCTTIAETINSALAAIEEIERNLYKKLDSIVSRTRALVSLINTKSLTGLELKKLRMTMAEIKYSESSVVETNGVEAVVDIDTNLDEQVFGGKLFEGVTTTEEAPGDSDHSTFKDKSKEMARSSQVLENPEETAQAQALIDARQKHADAVNQEAQGKMDRFLEQKQQESQVAQARLDKFYAEKTAKAERDTAHLTEIVNMRTAASGARQPGVPWVD